MRFHPGELPHRPKSEHGQGDARRDVGIVHALPGGGQDVRKVEVPLIREVFADPDGAAVGVRDPEQLGLPAGHRAVQLGETEQARAAVV
ncbi:hypothetical protein ABIB51_001155 [Arthrobacter sp. UYCu712]